ncbi:Cytochrome c-type biogenesis protein CcsB [uncultured Desulfobacterium sp.]|uniref:Cytochrome c-type biogenesis protein CcsB n=1 Tax=uncultured Desulfobacterium sp. TaxID=201089 RepID=A0A445N307_9BACT|nr:Cytochrome c-type biogenesis protein CcsB [uncultured Desulfobacterium sp.]
MTAIWFNMALVFELLAGVGFIFYLIKQQKALFRYSSWALLGGFIFHTIFLWDSYMATGAIPVLEFRSALSFFSWSIILAYLVFHVKFRLRVLASFITPFAAFLMIISSALPNTNGPVGNQFKSLWLTIHIIAAFMGNGMFAITFLGAIMYLILERSIKKKKLGSFYSRLPSLATLDSINYYSLVYGFILLTLGMITGSIYAQFIMGTYWKWDPKEVWSLITWLSYAVLIHERLAVGWRGRRAAVMSIICFCILIFTFAGVSLWFGGYHSFENLGARKAL